MTEQPRSQPEFTETELRLDAASIAAAICNGFELPALQRQTVRVDPRPGEEESVLVGAAEAIALLVATGLRFVVDLRTAILAKRLEVVPDPLWHNQYDWHDHSYKKELHVVALDVTLRQIVEDHESYLFSALDYEPAGSSDVLTISYGLSTRELDFSGPELVVLERRLLHFGVEYYTEIYDDSPENSPPRHVLLESVLHVYSDLPSKTRPNGTSVHYPNTVFHGLGRATSDLRYLQSRLGLLSK